MPEGRLERVKAFLERPAWSLKAPRQKFRVLLSVGRLRGKVEKLVVVGRVVGGSGKVGVEVGRTGWTPSAGAEVVLVSECGDLRRRDGMSDLKVDDEGDDWGWGGPSGWMGIGAEIEGRSAREERGLRVRWVS